MSPPSNMLCNRHLYPMLIAQWQNAVTRKDVVETYSFSDFKEVLFINFGTALNPMEHSTE